MTRSRAGQLMALAGIVGATMMLIALTWLGTLSATRIGRAEAEARVEANVASEAAEFEQQVRTDLLEVDQTLRILAHAWETDPEHFRLQPWRNHLVLLNEISPDVLIADEKGVVRDATVPEMVGSDVRERDYFRSLAERIFDDGRMFVSPSTMGPLVPQWHMNLAHPLHRADGSFAGVIVAALRINAMGRFYRMADIGTHGIIAVVDLEQGRVRVAVGPNPIDPGTSIAESDMFKVLQAAPDSVWVGRSSLDGIERVHGFHRVADRDLAVVVAMDRAEAMHTTNTWAITAYAFAGGVTVLLASLAAILMYAIRIARRRDLALQHERSTLASANRALELAKARADDKTMRLEATLAGMSDGVSMIDANMELVEWNARFPQIASVPADMLRVGLPMEDILRAQAVAGVFGTVDVEAEVARRIADLRAGVYEDIRERMAPGGRVVELRRNRLPDGGFVTLYTDVSARRESLNALREANALSEAATKAMARFVAIVSHEIRAPLNVLLTSLGLLADSGLAATEQALLAKARQSGDALLALINDILEMSRMEAGRLALRPGVFALRPLIASVLDMFRAQAAERRIALRVSIARDVPDELYEDPGRLRQVLINLLSNAVKFAAPGEVRVIAEERHQGDGRLIRLAVRDRGPAIDEASRARLFEPFSRLEDGSDVTPVGTGLGLTICRHLVVLMDGEIGCSVWTAGGREAGNEFWLTLPIKPAPDGAGKAAPMPGPQLRRSLPRTNILLVEDIPASQLVTATQLRREGHLVDLASNGPEAISAAAGRPYDVILMDIFMPGMSGLETTRRIRALGGPAATVPIIALTAHVCPEDHESCSSAGMQGMLCKPVALRELLDALAQHVWPHRSESVSIDAAVTRPASAVASVLAAARLDELRANLPADTLASLVEACLADLAGRLRLLQEAVCEQDGSQIVIHAHAMAGVSSEYGLAALQTRLGAVMRSAREAPDTVAALMHGLEAEMARTATALRELFRIEMV